MTDVSSSTPAVGGPDSCAAVRDVRSPGPPGAAGRTTAGGERLAGAPA